MSIIIKIILQQYIANGAIVFWKFFFLFSVWWKSKNYTNQSWIIWTIAIKFVTLDTQLLFEFGKLNLVNLGRFVEGEK